MWKYVATVGTVATLMLSGCGASDGGGSQEVSRDDFGDDWPLTVESGELACNRGAVTFSSGGTTYAVNGTAIALTDHPRIDEIWAEDEELDMDLGIGPLISRGLELC